MDKKSKSTKRLKAAKEINRIVFEYYMECTEAKRQGIPVGWMPPMNGAIEIFYAMGLQPVFPENWSPVCAAFGLAPGNFEISENMGYSIDLCGYLRNIIGYVHGPIKTSETILGNLPEPDFLISPGGGCVPVMKIFHALERRFPGAAVFRADLPQVALPDIQSHHVRYAVREIQRLISFLEETTGRKLDYTRLEEAVALSDRACALWDEIMSFRKYRPTPFSAAEIGIMFVMVTRQGTRTAVDFLEEVRNELQDRVARKQGVIPEEKVRLFWDNIPLWYNLGLFNYFEEMNGVVVAETYSTAWSIRLDPSDPITALAMKSLKSYPLVSSVSMETRRESILKACREYAIDGVIFHRNKSCLPITLGQMDIKRQLEEELNIPSIIIDADHMDERNFFPAQFKNRADAFMEMLLATKK
jgi:benzoyl-CoA reductase/2-hydroxyglutaryl-CoA dehydratase subunit BcrC/BadD/HgdB